MKQPVFEPCAQCLEAGVEVASGHRVGTSGVGAGTGKHTVRGRRCVEWSAGQVRKRSRELPAAQNSAGEAVSMIRQVVNSTDTEIVRPVEIGEPAIYSGVERLRGNSAAIQTVGARAIVD